MELLFFVLSIGAILAYFLYTRFAAVLKRDRRKTQSVILMEKIRTVCKLITVEGNFSEIYHYENVKDKWISALLGTKKALMLIDAKASVGFDLTKVKMEADVKPRTIKLHSFPIPHLMTIETDFKYYDKKEGWANPFTAEDLTEINQEAKQLIIDRVPSSGVMEEASHQAFDTLQLINKLVQTINWRLDYCALSIDNPKKELSSKNTFE
jgi:hypothetical protein